jgi:integrase
MPHPLPARTYKLIQVSRADLQKIVDRWALRYSPSTVGRIASVLRALFSYAVTAELVTRSPASGLRLPRTSLVERPVLSPEDLERLAKALGPDEAPMMWLGVICGLRWAECAGLAEGDLGLLAGRAS